MRFTRFVRLEGFSALQRAENSSILKVPTAQTQTRYGFQCSSASRKFLNLIRSPYLLLFGKVSVLFSEPKIPQCCSIRTPATTSPAVSVLFSEPKIPQWRPDSAPTNDQLEFQCSSASRKFLNLCRFLRHTPDRLDVSVLFSEPKIPQYGSGKEGSNCGAEFQCSSASRKFLNESAGARPEPRPRRFSALQRAENSSMHSASRSRGMSARFSALQRAENSSIGIGEIVQPAQTGFSALQRAENSSIYFHTSAENTSLRVSVLFSEPKIPQSPPPPRHAAARRSVSVLFSEPKIPQLTLLTRPNVC